MSKKLYTLLAAISITITTFAQAPEKMSYQAVVRDSGDALVTNQVVGMQISFLQGSASGTSVYTETQTPTTNINGLVTLEIGTGTTTDDFTAIDWATGPYFIKTETDPTGGSSYTITGTSQLLSVPYALYAKTAGNVFSGNYNDLSNQPTIPTINTYKVGDFAQGGIVFWVDESGQHGLVCALNDLSPNRWDAGSNLTTMATGDGPYSGEMNTMLIVAGQNLGDGNGYSALSCAEFSSNIGGKIYSDWYLASISELTILHDNGATIEPALLDAGGFPFSLNPWWSSSEISSTAAWVKQSTFAPVSAIKTTSSYTVRPIRSF